MMDSVRIISKEVREGLQDYGFAKVTMVKRKTTQVIIQGDER